jgi:hypothetical protein
MSEIDLKKCRDIARQIAKRDACYLFLYNGEVTLCANGERERRMEEILKEQDHLQILRPGELEDEMGLTPAEILS